MHKNFLMYSSFVLWQKNGVKEIMKLPLCILETASDTVVLYNPTVPYKDISQKLSYCVLLFTYDNFMPKNDCNEQWHLWPMYIVRKHY